jgi:hypothetical protein
MVISIQKVVDSTIPTISPNYEMVTSMMTEIMPSEQLRPKESTQMREILSLFPMVSITNQLSDRTVIAVVTVIEMAADYLTDKPFLRIISLCLEQMARLHLDPFTFSSPLLPNDTHWSYHSHHCQSERNPPSSIR